MKVYEEMFVNQNLVEAYSKGRPTYPPALFEMLASLTHQHERAWDVGTGNGQAAISVAKHYKSVIATDVSEQQLSLGKKTHNITYAKMSATPASAEELERIVGPEGSVDLVTVATALQWFDRDKFYPIVKRLLRKPGGVFAVWSYSRKTMKVCPEFDKELERWFETMTPYMALTRTQVEDLSFPFDPVPGLEAGKGVQGSPLKISMEKVMSLDDFIVMMKSFSPIQTALEQGVDLLNEDATEALAKAWGSERVHTVSFPIFVLMGTISSPTAN